MELVTKEQKKEFALSKIAPYFKNPELCGYNGEHCKYLTEDGKMCVVGSCMINPKEFLNNHTGVFELLERYSDDILKEDCRNILTPKEWNSLQTIHDCIAERDTVKIELYIINSKLFTYKELQAYANKV